MINPDSTSVQDFEFNKAAYEGHCDITTVHCADIPKYLHDSAFYKSLSSEEDEALIGVPRQCFKPDDAISSLAELTNLLHVMMFWGMDEIPFSVLEFLQHKHVGEWQHCAADILDPGNCNALLMYFANNCSLDGVIQSNRWQIMLHWMQHNPPDDPKAIMAIFHMAKYGLLDAIKRMHEHEYPIDASACVVAAEQGHTHCVQYFHENGIVLTNVVATAAAKHGHMDCLMYLFAHNCPMDESTCAAAAECGSIECLQLLHRGGCPWDEFVTYQAAKHNHTVCLMYALIHSCPVHKDAYLLAAAHPVACLQLLCDHTTDMKWNSSIANNAARYGQLDTLQYAIEHGCPTDDDTVEAAMDFKGDSLPCLKYLIEEVQVYMDERGFPFTHALMLADIDSVMYFVDNGCPCVVRRMRYIKLESYRDSKLQLCIEYMLGHGWECSEYFIQLVFTCGEGRNRIRI